MLANKPSAMTGEDIAVRSCAPSLGAFVLVIACTALPVAAQPLPAASPGTSAAGGAAARSVAAGSACGVLEEDITDQKKTDEQRIAKQLYDTARLPQPFHGVLSSDVLPAEGLTRLTIDTRVNAIQQSCVMAFLVDETWGLKTWLTKPGGSRTSARAFPFGQCRHF